MTNTNNKCVDRKKLMLIAGCIVLLAVIVTVCIIIGFSVENKADTNNNIQQQEVLEKGFDIETPYATLSYPLKWKEEVKIQHIDSDVYTVEFYLPMDDNDDLHLFDIAFGGTEGDSIGLLNYNGGKVDIRVVSYEIGSDWSEEDLETISDMLEDVNHIIQSLESNVNFEGL